MAGAWSPPGADRLALVLGLVLGTFLGGLGYVRWTTAQTLRDPLVMGRLPGVTGALAVAVLPVPTIASVVAAAAIMWATAMLRGRSGDLLWGPTP